MPSPNTLVRSSDERKRRPVPSLRLARRLLLATVVPASLGLAAFGFFAHEVARLTLEDELGRRLSAVAVAAAMQILPEQIQAIGAGDEASRTYSNLAQRLRTNRDRFRVRRLALLAADGTARGDTSEKLALGAKAHAFLVDANEIEAARTGTPTASLLFIGNDGRRYMRAYAGVARDAEPAAGVVVVEGNAGFYEPLLRFRRWLAIWGVAGLIVLVLLTMFVARRITDPLARLARAADRMGRGELDQPVPVETRDEVGLLARRLDEMRAALRARDERTQMMLAGIAHEVRNPLGGLQLFAGLLREGLSHGDPQMEGLKDRLAEIDRMQKEIGYLDTVVNEFLDYARRPAPQRETLGLQRFLFECWQMSGVGESGFELDCPADLQVSADRVQLRRAVMNLLQNARSAAGPQGRIVLVGRRDEAAENRRIAIEVRDSGPGIAKEISEKVFTPFFTTREKGTGLGLAFVRDIATDHGGAVQLGPAPEGGACVRILL